MSDRWETYLCSIENRPASILVDLAARDDEAGSGLDHVIWVRVRMRAPRPDGLSSDEEFEALAGMESRLAAAAGASRALRYVGRCTTNGERHFFFHARNANAAILRIHGVLDELADYECAVGSREEPDWRTYTGFLYPTERVLLTIRNRRQLEELAERGERTAGPRTVVHTLLARDADSARALAAGAEQVGCRVVESRPDGAEGEEAVLLDLEQRSAAEPDAIDATSLALLELAQRHGASYAGWRTKSESPG